MKAIVVVLLLSSLGLVFSDDCEPCDPNSCVEPVNCVAGQVPDRCKCCHVCGRAEGEFCDLKDKKHMYGPCGEHLECRERSDIPEEGVGLCYCEYEENLCGSDGLTYRSLCHLNEVNNVGKKNNITIKAKGPCKSQPKIITGPEHQKNHTGGYVALACEAHGYPIPAIDWIFTRANGKAIQLPEDDKKVSLNIRGGPEKYEITGWIQIMNIEKKHEGDYTCVASNKHGKDKAQARVIVLDENDERDREL